MIQYATNFTVIQLDFGDVILDIRDGDGSGRFSTGLTQRKIIKLMDGSYFRIREHLTKKSEIELYFYDWFGPDGKELLKFHSEIHVDDKRYQTKTEPYHIHVPEELRLSSMTRLPNHNHRELYGIMEFVRLHLTLIKIYR